MTPRQTLLALGLVASLGLAGWMASQPDVDGDADDAAAGLLPPAALARGAARPGSAMAGAVTGQQQPAPDGKADTRSVAAPVAAEEPSSEKLATSQAGADAANPVGRRQPWPVPDSTALLAWQPLMQRPAAMPAAAGSARMPPATPAASAAPATAPAAAASAAAAASTPPSPPPERPAPLPFTLVGGLDDGSGAVAWLVTPQRTLAVRAGDSLPGGWRVDTVAAGQVDITRQGGSDRRSLRYPTP